MDGQSSLLAIAACAEQGSTSGSFTHFPDDAKFILDSCPGELVPTESTLEAAAGLLAGLLGRKLSSSNVASLCMAASGCPRAALPQTVECCFKPAAEQAEPQVAGLNLKFLEQAASELHSQEYEVLRALAKAAPAVQDADALREKVDISKRIWLLRAAGWLPSSSCWLPVFRAQVTASTAQVAQVLAMDDSEFWAFRSTCEFFVRKALPGGGFTPWVPARGPSYLVSNSKAKGGGITVHGDAAFMKAAGINEDGDSSDYSDDEDSAPAAEAGNMSRRKRKKAAGPTIGTRPSASSKAQKAAAQSAVQVMLGGKTPQEAFEQGLLRVDAPAVPLPQSWTTAASDEERSAVPLQCTVVPTAPSHALGALSLRASAEHREKLDTLLADPVNAALARRLGAWMVCLAGLAPGPAAEEGAGAGSDSELSAAAQEAEAAKTAPVPAAPTSSFAFSVSLPGAKPAQAGATASASAAAVESDSEHSDSEDDDVLDKYCLDGVGMPGSDDEAGDIRQGAYVVLARALQLQIQALTTAEEAVAVTNAAASRCAPNKKESVVAGCGRAAVAVAQESSVLQLLLSRISAAEPEVLEFLGEDEQEESDFDGEDSDASSADEEDSPENEEDSPAVAPAAAAGAAASGTQPKKASGTASDEPAESHSSDSSKAPARVKFSVDASDADFEAAAPRAGKSPATGKAGGKKRRRW